MVDEPSPARYPVGAIVMRRRVLAVALGLTVSASCGAPKREPSPEVGSQQPQPTSPRPDQAVPGSQAQVGSVSECAALAGEYWHDVNEGGELRHGATIPEPSWQTVEVAPTLPPFLEHLYDEAPMLLAPPLLTRATLESRGARHRQGEVAEDILELTVDSGWLYYWDWENGVPTRARHRGADLQLERYMEFRYTPACRAR